MNTVQKLLRTKGSRVWTIAKGSNVAQAMQLMGEKHIGALVILDGKQVVGIFTERDYARKFGSGRRKLEDTHIEEVMTRDLITVVPNQSIKECMVLMTENRVRHLPVMDGSRLVGIISIGDVVKDLIEELEFHVDQLTKYITGLR